MSSVPTTSSKLTPIELATYSKSKNKFVYKENDNKDDSNTDESTLENKPNESSRFKIIVLTVMVSVLLMVSIGLSIALALIVTNNKNKETCKKHRNQKGLRLLILIVKSTFWLECR